MQLDFPEAQAHFAPRCGASLTPANLRARGERNLNDVHPEVDF